MGSILIPQKQTNKHAREMQTKTIVSYHFTSIKVARIKKSENHNFGQDVEIL
jgi:hypothetical protein